jgi:hypothetical protein
LIFGIGSAIGITLWKAGETITDYATKGVEWVKQKGAAAVEKMKQTLKSGGDMVMDMVKKAGDYIKGAYEGVKDFTKNAYTAVASSVSSSAKFISDAFMKGWDYAGSVFESTDFASWENEYELAYNISFNSDSDNTLD